MAEAPLGLTMKRPQGPVPTACRPPEKRRLVLAVVRAMPASRADKICAADPAVGRRRCGAILSLLLRNAVGADSGLPEARSFERLHVSTDQQRAAYISEVGRVLQTPGHLPRPPASLFRGA